MVKPTLRELQQPPLSVTLEGEIHPLHCRSCSGTHTKGNPLARWMEHDELDRVYDRPVVITLCKRCSDRLIEPHPRLYRALDTGESMPGSMSICVDCVQRQGMRCTSSKSQINGGEGLRFTWDSPPIHAHVCRSPRRLSGFMTIYSSPVRTCDDRKTLTLDKPTAEDTKQ